MRADKIHKHDLKLLVALRKEAERIVHSEDFEPAQAHVLSWHYAWRNDKIVTRTERS
jgi:hypothetical protein